MPCVVTHYSIRMFASLRHALHALGPYVRDPSQLRSGRETEALLGLRPREALANWLVCVASNEAISGPYTFTSDPLGGDGVILDETTRDTFPTEHVAVILPPGVPDPDGQAGELIVTKIEAKNNRGASYCRGKVLIVFMETPAGTYYPNHIARALPEPFHFDQAWLVGLQRVESDGTYVYAVTWLQIGPFPNAPTFLVRVAPTFDDWAIEQFQ